MAVAASSLTSLASLKTWLGISVSTYDTILETCIDAASKRIARECNRPAFAYDAARAEYVAGYGTGALRVALTPVRVVASISFDGNAVDIDELEYDVIDDYDNDTDGILRLPGGFAWTAAWDVASVTGQGVLGSERKMYLVTFSCGWVTPNQATEELLRDLPADLEMACWELAGSMYLNRARNQAVKSERLESWSASYSDSADDLSSTVRGLISPYVRLS